MVWGCGDVVTADELERYVKIAPPAEGVNDNEHHRRGSSIAKLVTLSADLSLGGNVPAEERSITLNDRNTFPYVFTQPEEL